MKRLTLIALFIAIFYFGTAQDYTLPNLGFSKKAIREYVKSGQYELDQKKAIDDALLILDNLKIPGAALVIFDVDETTLTNMEYELNFDFGYERESWDKWVQSAKAPAMQEVKRFYDTLISRNINVVFITGRSTGQYESTLKNLNEQGYTKFDTLICKSPEFSGKKAIEYKTEVRRRLSQKYNIIATVGDQWSDLDGGYAIMKVKLPNLFYFLD